MDELVIVSKKIRLRDNQSCSVILDFKIKQVVQCSLDGVVVPKDWQRIRDYYYQHYKQMIDQLETLNAAT